MHTVHKPNSLKRPIHLYRNNLRVTRPPKNKLAVHSQGGIATTSYHER
jgi:hypothetical protein